MFMQMLRPDSQLMMFNSRTVKVDFLIKIINEN